MQDPETVARAALFRSLLIYTALFAVDVLFVYYIVMTTGARGGGFVSLSIVGVVGLLLGYQVVQHFRDTQTPLAESQGVIQRKWERADLIIAWKSQYITMGRTVYRVKREDYDLLEEGMYVKIVHFPNTLNVVSIHEVLRPPPDPSASI